MLKNHLILSLALGLAACSAPEAVYISGSSTVLPPVSKAADKFSTETDVIVVVNAGGSGGGFNQLAEGQSDIGMCNFRNR